MGPDKEHFNTRLMKPTFLFREVDHTGWVMTTWDENDPLSHLFATWFGCYRDEAVNKLREEYAEFSGILNIPLGGSVTDINELVTPIMATTLGIEYGARVEESGFCVLDPQSPEDLLAFWNLRARGAEVFPWPVAEADRLAEAAKRWLQNEKQRGRLDRWRTGDGRPAGSRINIWRSPTSEGIPDELVTLLGSELVKLMDCDFSDFIPGWMGTHPFSTRYTHWFKVPAELEGRSAEIPLPQILGEGGQSSPEKGVVAIDVEIDSVVQIEPGWTYRVPNRRDLAKLLPQYMTEIWFHRPTHDGRAMGVFASSDVIEIQAIQSMAIVESLIEINGWKCRQTSNGIFSLQLIERLGGLGSSVANEPGGRAALEAAAASANGCKSGELISKIKRFQGAWPSPLSHRSIVEDYSGSMLRRLLTAQILKPVLPMVCPHCRTKTAIRPEGLSSEMNCEMCLRKFPLGLSLALSVNGRNDWSYRLSGHVNQRQLSEVLAVMATLHILATVSRIESPNLLPQA
ncbi:hypothetical protein HHX38_29150, partial [Streptomyces sp. PKU-MA01144]|uniref:hypothetical protein n=1 Tax=Streptomyces sp. PKU-MA01144 TaxID=2729138 RepID=UPI00147C0ABB